MVTIGYFSLDSAGGSGYLGAFLAGLIVGNMERLGLAMHSEHERDMRQFAFNVADLVTLFVFVVLGANIPFDDLGEYLLPALAVSRPCCCRAAADGACLRLPDRGAGGRARARFLCWTRETGSCRRRSWACSPASASPNTELYASVVALAVVVTLLVQALPAGWLAGRLGLLDGPAPVSPEPGRGLIATPHRPGPQGGRGYDRTAWA